MICETQCLYIDANMLQKQRNVDRFMKRRQYNEATRNQQIIKRTRTKL